MFTGLYFQNYTYKFKWPHWPHFIIPCNVYFTRMSLSCSGSQKTFDLCSLYSDLTLHIYRQVVFIWRLTLFYFNKKGLLKCGLYLQDGRYSEVAFNIGLTLYIMQEHINWIIYALYMFYLYIMKHISGKVM